MAPRVTGSGSGRRRRQPDANPQTRASTTPQPRPLAPASIPSSINASSSSNAQVLDPNINPRLQGVVMDDDEVVQVRADPASEANMQAGNGDVDLAAAVSGLLLLGATTGPVTLGIQSETATESAASGPLRSSTRAARKNKGVKRQKLGEPETPVPPAAELSIYSFKSRRLISGRAVPRFNIFQAILQHVHIFFHFVTCLDVDSLISLYAISKDLHNMVNTCNSAIVLAQAMRYAPIAASTFPFRCYRSLCNEDPRVDLDVTRGQTRMIPSFRWLRMIHYRQQTAQKIVRLLNEEGLYLPQEQGERVVKKIWFLMDIPDNQRRLATIRNLELWTAADLFYACMFFMRIDMRCTDPLIPIAHANIRRMLMAQPSLTMTCLVLDRKFLLDKHQAMQTYMRWKHIPVDGQQRNVFGVPRHELGLVQYEGYGKHGSRVKLQRPDELVLKECVRREMQMETAFFCMLNWVGPQQVNTAASANAAPTNAAAANANVSASASTSSVNANSYAAASAAASVAANDDDDDATEILDEADM